jgi:hypothetical protein
VHCSASKARFLCVFRHCVYIYSDGLGHYMFARSLRTLGARLDCTLQGSEGTVPASGADKVVLKTVDVRPGFAGDAYAMKLAEQSDTTLVGLVCRHDHSARNHCSDNVYVPWEKYDDRFQASVHSRYYFSPDMFRYIYMVFNEKSSYLLLMNEVPLKVIKAPWEKTESLYRKEVPPPADHYWIRNPLFDKIEYKTVCEACDNKDFLRPDKFQYGRLPAGQKFNEIERYEVTDSRIQLEFWDFKRKPEGKFRVTFLLPTESGGELDPPP